MPEECYKSPSVFVNRSMHSANDRGFKGQIEQMSEQRAKSEQTKPNMNMIHRYLTKLKLSQLKVYIRIVTLSLYE